MTDASATTDRSNRWRDGMVVATELVVYIIAFLILERWIGRSAAIFSILPVFAGAMRRGAGGGIVVAVICVAINMLLFTFADSTSASYGFRLVDLPGNLGLIAIGGLVGVLRDRQIRSATEANERRIVERLALESEKKLRSILEHAPTFIAMTNRQGELLFLNRSTDQRPQDLIGRSILDFIDEAQHQRVSEILDWVANGHGDIESDIQVIRLDGTRGVFRAIFAPVPVGEGAETIIVNATDITELRELEALRARFVDKVVAVQEEERRRIARELHDVTAQALTSLLIGLRVLGELPDKAAMQKRLEELRGLAGDTLDDLNQLARGLHPSVLDDVGFAAALERYCSEFGVTHGIETDLEIVGLGVGTRLPPPIEITLYRIAQEALINVAKHAGAKNVSVVVERKGDTVRAIIEDNGCGVRLNEITGMPGESDGLGLLGIRERAELVGGSITIESSPGNGTTVFVTLPAAPNLISIRAS